MKYILLIAALAFVVDANAQTGLQQAPGGAAFQLFTHNAGDKVKVNDVVTFDFVQKTDKDSVLMSSYGTGKKAQVQIVDPKGVTDMVEINLMEIFPLLAVNDSVLIKLPTDSIFKGHDDQRPPFFPKGSNLNFVIKIDRIQSLEEAMAEHKAEEEKIKTAELTDAANYIVSHKLVLKTTASGLKYVVTKSTLKQKPLKGDTLQVNYTGRTLDDKVFDSSIESVAKAAALNQPGRTYEPIQFVVGTGGVIPGWDEGLLLLNEGEKATLVIPSSLAYGAQPQGDAIKPYSTLVFDVELVKIKPGPRAGNLAKTDGAGENPPSVHELILDPYFGLTSKITFLRSTPSYQGKVVKQLPVNTSLYVLSNSAVTGFYKAVEIKTGKTGWVNKTVVKLNEKAKGDAAGDFKKIGASATSAPELVIKNSSSAGITLIVGEESFAVAANSSRTVSVGKGKKYVVVASPGLTPKSGYQEFVSHEKYEWQYSN